MVESIELKSARNVRGRIPTSLVAGLALLMLMAGLAVGAFVAPPRVETVRVAERVTVMVTITVTAPPPKPPDWI
jgi:hypothetical protein